MERHYITNLYKCITYYREIDLFNMGMEILDVSEGCLIDNLICSDKDGNIHIYAEKPLNVSSSGLVEICEDMTDSAKWDYWYENFAIDDKEE